MAAYHVVKWTKEGGISWFSEPLGGQLGYDANGEPEPGTEHFIGYGSNDVAAVHDVKRNEGATDAPGFDPHKYDRGRRPQYRKRRW